jgi:hypothetical protein
MNRDDIEKLLGGYAPGTLTPEEQQALFEAALHDQALFDQLADEQSLRDLLRDPAARAQLLASLEDQAGTPWYRRWWRPLVASAAMAAVASVGIYLVRNGAPARRPVAVAEVRLPPAPEKAPETAAALPPAPERKREVRKAAAPKPAPAAPLAAQGSVAVSLGAVRASDAAAPGARALYYAAGASEQKAAAAPSPGSPARPMMSMARLAQLGGAPAAAHLGLKYSVLRQSATGEFTEADPAQVQSGDTIRLRFEANDPGYLYLWDPGGNQDPPAILLERARPFETPPWRADAAGRRSFRVLFARRPVQPANSPNTAGASLSEADPGAGATFVVDRGDDTASQQVAFTIALEVR